MTEYIERLKKLVENISEGPWSTRGYSPDKIFGPFFGAGPDTSYEQSYFDAQFIAESRTAIPKLIEYIEKLESLIDVAKKMSGSCFNAGMYGPLNISPGKCDCSRCEFERQIKKIKGAEGE